MYIYNMRKRTSKTTTKRTLSTPKRKTGGKVQTRPTIRKPR